MAEEWHSFCLSCGKPTRLQCSQCRVIHFCNKECQKAIWKSHKAFCKSIAKPTTAPPDEQAGPTKPTTTCLIVDGMGPCGPDWKYMTGARRALLAAGVGVYVVDATKGNKIVEQITEFLKKSQYNFINNVNDDKKIESMIMLGWGGGSDVPVCTAFCTNPKFREAAVEWCAAGGRFIVQGELVRRTGNWPSWFNNDWKDDSYYRTDHTCFAAGASASAGGNTHWCQWYPNATGSVTSKYNVKACMLKDVAPSDILFGTTNESKSYSLVPGFGGVEIGKERVAIAFSQFDRGTVSFFGDVNFEDETLRIMAIVARGF